MRHQKRVLQKITKKTKKDGTIDHETTDHETIDRGIPHTTPLTPQFTRQPVRSTEKWANYFKLSVRNPSGIRQASVRYYVLTKSFTEDHEGNEGRRCFGHLEVA
jgi:hypothetical protein